MSFFFALAIYDHLGTKRMPYAVIVDTLLKIPGLADFFRNLGVIPASRMKILKTLPSHIKIFGIYPEGETGNCKPFWKAYRMQPWKPGFVRLALERRCKIVPLAIIGGEECLPTLKTIEVLKPIIGTVIPLPLLLFPLPTS